MSAIQAKVNDATLRAESEGVDIDIKGTKRGEVAIIDFLTAQALAGRAFQVRAGTITTPAVGDVVITDTKCEMCTDAFTGLTIIPVELFAGIRLATGTLHEYFAKSIAVVSTSGTVFTALPLMTGGNAARSGSRAAEAGGVVVTAELATTTRQLWAYATPLATVDTVPQIVWQPRLLSPLKGPACFYVQIAATTTGPSYYASYDFIELDSVAV